MLHDFDDSKMYESIASGNWRSVSETDSAQNQWYFVAMSYRKAADLLVDELPNALLMGVERVYIACPIMFLYRHYFELELKALMLDLQALGKQKRVHHNQTAKIFDDKLPGHPLLKCWEPVRDMLLAITDEAYSSDAEFTEANAIYRTIEERIKEFDKIDEGSMGYRYPTDREAKNQTLAPLPGARELSHVKEIVEVIAGYFGSIETWVHQERNYISEAWHDYYYE